MFSKSSANRLVCFFDSGIGGLNLMYSCYKRRKDCNFAYFADNYNMPYGSLPKSEVLLKVDGIFQKISLLNPAVAVVACNTVTAECIDYLRKKYNFPIVGIQPAIKPAAKLSKKCLVLATEATVNSSAVKDLAAKYGNKNVVLAPCPNLAAYIENNIFNIKENEIRQLLPPADCDGVVLGCTHYTYVADAVSRFYGCGVFDGVEGTVNQICKILGIFDHHENCRQEVAFYGGNCLKNAQIFEYLKNNLKFCEPK